jgi:hypothetical protein
MSSDQPRPRLGMGNEPAVIVGLVVALAEAVIVLLAAFGL